MIEAIIIIDVLAAVALVALVLLQQGKGADMGAAFGSGASQTLFGARGSANFLTRTTAVLAVVFFVANILLAYFASRTEGPKSITERIQIEQPATLPERPAAPEVPQAPKVPEVPK